jgi:hypothetical protein
VEPQTPTVQLGDRQGKGQDEPRATGRSVRGGSPRLKLSKIWSRHSVGTHALVSETLSCQPDGPEQADSATQGISRSVSGPETTISPVPFPPMRPGLCLVWRDS